MTTATTERAPFVPLPTVGDISTPNLTDRESAKLLDCINGLRSGEHVYLVRVTYHKQTKSPARIAGEDYEADPALVNNAHEGILYAAPTNKRQEVYIRMADGARRPSDEAEHGYTCLKPEGILTLRVLGEFPGPIAQERERQAQEREAQERERQAQERERLTQAAQPQADQNMLMAQAMFAQAQALMFAGQSMLTQAQQTPNPRSGG